jgi:type III pantothenate kinase
MFLALDIGNSRLKAALFNQVELQDTWSFATAEAQSFVGRVHECFSKFPAMEAMGVSSGARPEGLSERIQWLDVSSNWPIQIDYKSPETLGIDRLLAASAAFLEYGSNVLVVTAGTCITYNVVHEGKFKGGAISPGLNMRFQAMHSFTAALPNVESDPEAALLGTDTISNLQAGVNVALPLEVESMILRYCEEFNLEKVVICGGDRNALRNPLKKHIFAPSNYELHALKQLHEYFKNQGLS